jgi:hypothetical protein
MVKQYTLESEAMTNGPQRSCMLGGAGAKFFKYKLLALQ